MSRLKKLFAKNTKLKVAASAAVLFLVLGSIWYSVQAAGFFVASETEAGTLATNATAVTDSSASGGRAIQFNAPAPVTPTPTPTNPTPGASRCPAYPAFPDASCTGVIPGTTLTSCNGNINTANATFTNCLFSSSVILGSSARNVKITNSKILGIVTSSSGWFANSGLVMTDVEIDGQNTNSDQIGGITHYTCLRCNIHHGAKSVAGGQFRIEDSYLHDIYGSGDSHNEAILPFDGHNNVILHNSIISNWSSSTQGGGMSAAIALYTHSDFWGSIDNVLIEKNRITTKEAWFCMYGGHTNDTDGKPSNIRIIDNVFGPCSFQTPETRSSVMVGWLRGNGNVWSGNKWYSDGAVIPEPSTGIYN